MILIENVFKEYPTRQGKVTILQDINCIIPAGKKIGIIGRNGSGKSTLIRMISGAELPTSGKIKRLMSVSWPLAFSGAYQGSLTGLDNLKFICRIYNTTIEDKIPFIQEFSELGKYLYEPVKNYSSGMRARLSFAISLAIDFDCYLIDEIIAVGDSRFHEKCNIELFEKRKDKSMIIVSHQPQYIIDHCEEFAVLKSGRLYDFNNSSDAITFYEDNALI